MAFPAEALAEQLRTALRGNLPRVFEQVGIELRSEIDDYFSSFTGR